MNIQLWISNFLARWPEFLFIALRVIFIAIAFEVAVWFLGRKLEKAAAAFEGIDQTRDAKWRQLRRLTLKGAPKIALRLVLYSVAIVLVFDAFGVPVLPLSLSIGAVALLFGAALIPVMRDYSQGYFLLSEDSLAPGDVVEINGFKGTVEKWTLRATWLRDSDGRLIVLSNRDVRDVVIYGKAIENAETGARPRTTGKTNKPFDPLDA